MMFWTEIYLQHGPFAFDGNNTHESEMILHNFSLGSIFIFIFFRSPHLEFL